MINACAIEFNSELCAIQNWSNSNNLALNPSKCKCLVISKRPLDTESVPDIIIGNEKIELVEIAKNLGIYFNRSLSFEYHIRITIGKVYGMLRSLWITQPHTPKDIRLLLAKTYIIPVLLYGCELFVNMDSLSKQKLHVVFNNITRYVFGLRRYDSVSSHSKQLFNMTLENLLNLRSLILLHKIIYTDQPQYLKEHVQFMRSSRTKQVKPIRYNSLISERHFFVNTIRLWNALPISIQSICSVPNFKRQLGLHFQNLNN